MQGTVLKRSTTFHPHTDGNRCLETYVRCSYNEKPKQRDKWLPWTKHWYNTTFHISINTTFSMFFKRKPPPLIFYGERETSNDAIEQTLKASDEILKRLKKHLLIPQNQMKKFADSNRRRFSWKLGRKSFSKFDHTGSGQA